MKHEEKCTCSTCIYGMTIRLLKNYLKYASMKELLKEQKRKVAELEMINKAIKNQKQREK